MNLSPDRSYKATRAVGEVTWHGTAVSHAGNGRRVQAEGETPEAALEAADNKLTAELGGPVMEPLDPIAVGPAGPSTSTTPE